MGTTSSARRPALCCECGNVRTVSPNAYPRRADPYSRGEGETPERLEFWKSKGLREGMDPYWRALMMLKCSACGEQTRHALTREEGCLDYCEEEARRVDMARRELNARLHRLELAGIDVRWRGEGDRWTSERTIIQLYEYRDESPRWYVQVREAADPDQLIRQLVDVERTIDREDLTYEWKQDSDGAQWRGKCYFG